MGNQEKVAKASKGTMTDISMMQKTDKPAQLKPTGAPRRRSNFADLEKRRQSDLTDQEVKLARQIWMDHVEPVKEEFIKMVISEFFVKYPKFTDVFLRLESLGISKLSIPMNMAFKDHHLARIYVRLREIMDNLRNPKRLTRLMIKLGLLYARMDDDPNSSVLVDFQNVMVSTIRIAMSNQMHPVEETALRKCFDLAFSIMEEASFTYYDLFVATQERAVDLRTKKQTSRFL